MNFLSTAIIPTAENHAMMNEERLHVHSDRLLKLTGRSMVDRHKRGNRKARDRNELVLKALAEAANQDAQSVRPGQNHSER